MRGNVVDMAVGVVVGGAFGKITSSLVNNVIMPPVGLLVGGVDFSALSITLRPASEGVEAVAINYGEFINTVLDFVIIAFAIFMRVNNSDFATSFFEISIYAVGETLAVIVIGIGNSDGFNTLPLQDI